MFAILLALAATALAKSLYVNDGTSDEYKLASYLSQSTPSDPETLTVSLSANGIFYTFSEKLSSTGSGKWRVWSVCDLLENQNMPAGNQKLNSLYSPIILVKASEKYEASKFEDEVRTCHYFGEDCWEALKKVPGVDYLYFVVSSESTGVGGDSNTGQDLTRTIIASQLMSLERYLEMTMMNLVSPQNLKPTTGRRSYYDVPTTIGPDFQKFNQVYQKLRENSKFELIISKETLELKDLSREQQISLLKKFVEKHKSSRVMIKSVEKASEKLKDINDPSRLAEF